MKIPVSKAYAKWMDEDAARLNAMAELARKVAVTLPSKKEAEKRAFCPTGPGGGIDNSCSAVSASDPSLKERVPFTPIGDDKNSDFIRVPSVDELTEALTGSNSSKGTKIGSAKDLPAGTPVALRIDIPAFNYSTKNMGKAIYAVTIHENKGGKSFGSPLAYEPMARLTGPVTFAAKEKEATKVATGEANKFPLATVKGNFDPSRTMPPDIDSWTPVGYDPKKAAYFYDKKTGREVMGGTDAVSVGNSVFVRIPKYGYRNAKETYRDAGFWGVECRADDCGRQDGGKFGPGNKCQEEGDGGTATSADKPSTPSSTTMPTGRVGDPEANTAWLSPSGSLYPIPRVKPPALRLKSPRGFTTHDEWASLHGHENGGDDLLKSGWARVSTVSGTLYVNTGEGRPLTASQKKTVKDHAIIAGHNSVVHDHKMDRPGRTIWDKNDRSFDEDSEDRAFCATGEGGGINNSCSSADAGIPSGGGGSASTVELPQHFGPQSNSTNKLSWDREDGDPPFPGAEKFESISVSAPRQVNKSFDEIGISPTDAIGIAGSGSGGGYAMFRPANEFVGVHPFAGSKVTPVFMDFERDVAGVKNGLTGSSVLGVTRDGSKVVFHNTLSVMDAVRSDPIKRHTAAREFYRTMVESVEASRRAGVSVVAFNAAGHSAADSAKGNANPWRGYTIWPRMGFDGPLPKHIIDKLPPELSHARTLMDLHATREGTKWWAKNGEDIDVQLDLSDRNSPQNKVFDRFVKHFSRDRRDLPLGEGDGWLSPEDLARLDEMWAEIWDDEDILDDYDGGEQKFVVESRSADCGRDEGGRFGQGNKCQEDGDGGSQPASMSTYESIAIQRDADRISRSAATGDVQSLRSAVEIAMERSTPNQIAKSLGFSDFDQDGSMSDALKRPVSLSQSFASTRKSAAVSHLVSLASAASFVPEIKQVPIDFDSFDSWAGRISKEHGVSKSAFKGFIAACDLTNGRVTAMFDVPPGDDRRLRNYEGNIHSTDHPAHYIVHEYAHTLQSRGVRQALIDEREQSLKYAQGTDAASERRRSELESDISRLKSGGNLTESEISSYVQGARLVSIDLESEDMKSFLSSHYRSILASGSTDDAYAASRLDYLSSDESSGLKFRPDDSEFGLWSEGRQKFAADNPDSWTAASRHVSLYGSTSELELAAEYFTAVTLGYKKNVDVLDRFCERLHMPRPQQKVPDSASPRKKAAKKLRL